MKPNIAIVFAAIAVGLAASLFGVREAFLISRVLNAETSVDAGRANPAPDQSGVSYALCVGDETVRRFEQEETTAEREYHIRLSAAENRISYYTSQGGLLDFCREASCEVTVQPWRASIISANLDSLSYAFSLDRKTGELEYAWFSSMEKPPVEEFKGVCKPADAPVFDTSDNVL